MRQHAKRTSLQKKTFMVNYRVVYGMWRALGLSSKDSRRIAYNDSDMRSVTAREILHAYRGGLSRRCATSRIYGEPILNTSEGRIVREYSLRDFGSLELLPGGLYEGNLYGGRTKIRVKKVHSGLVSRMYDRYILA